MWEDDEGMYWRRCPQKDDERDLKEDLDEGDEKRDGYRTMREGTDEDVPKGTVGSS